MEGWCICLLNHKTYHVLTISYWLISSQWYMKPPSTKPRTCFILSIQFLGKSKTLPESQRMSEFPDAEDMRPLSQLVGGNLTSSFDQYVVHHFTFDDIH
ncbi:hypothetical protein NPIL_33661 [Nephila pilipes]|uniref:Uncharacterized protein n=1 Tax=Nephila pilipes TaxID=299642 RepID=A0A8X6QNY1_NEPPI|nr:hypothetical protein NPIL_33661 [Nephila pilipes]